MEALSEMLWPLLACLLLVGIHAYLGIHVIARKVIFVDLALAQIAGLGAVYGVFIGLSFETDAWLIKGVSVLFTLFGAMLFSFTRTPDERIPHEAIIGIIYAAALSMTVLVTANLPHGADEVRQMLAGSILWVTKQDVAYTAVLYSAVGLLHFVFRRQFFLLSKGIAHAQAHQLNIPLWDFLFYASFGVVVTSSVGMGGVLLVFGYLVIPSVIGVMVAQETKWRLLVGWFCGALMSVVGVIVSYYLDLPSGPTIVVLLGLLLVVVALARELTQRKTRGLGIMHCAFILGMGCVVMLTPLLTTFSSHDHGERQSRLHALSHSNNQAEAVGAALLSHDDEEVMEALNAVRSYWLVDLLPKVLPLVTASDSKKRERAVKVIGSLGDARGKDALRAALEKEKDVFIKLEMAEALLSLGDKHGLLVLDAIMKIRTSEFAADDALSHLRERLPEAPRDAGALSEWLKTNFHRLRFEQEKQVYHLSSSL